MSQSEEAKAYGIKAEGESVAALISRIANEQSDYLSYSQPVRLSNITIKNGILTYEREGVKFSFSLPSSVRDAELYEVASLCIVKQGDMVSLFEECPACNLDGVCTYDECKEDCPDCYGPDSVCIGDGFCNRLIGENCENSKDCECFDGVCCPSAPDADEKGCSGIQGLSKGDECWCSNQCQLGLECNPTTPEFKDYERACCDPSKGWNGTDCVVTECTYPCAPGCVLPNKWDWRNVNGVNYLNPIRNQGRCGSCWAFSAVGAVEGTYNVEFGCPSCNKDLAEQQLVSNDASCCGSCGDCNGGIPHFALNYIKTRGVVDEGCCPYTAKDTGCPVCSDYSTRLWKVSEYGFVSNSIEDIKRALICEGPLSVATPWRPPYGHAIVLVGYDDDSQICKNRYNYPGCWIIRNSWGVFTGTRDGVWHEDGYGYVPYEGILQSQLRNYVLYVKGVEKP